MKRNPDKEVFCLGSALDDEDDAEDRDAGDNADDVDIKMIMKRNL